MEEIHLAGHDARDDLLIDTHGGGVSDTVIELFERVIDRAPMSPVLIEWDTQLPSWGELWTEGQCIELIRRQALSRRAA